MVDVEGCLQQMATLTHNLMGLCALSTNNMPQRDSIQGIKEDPCSKFQMNLWQLPTEDQKT